MDVLGFDAAPFVLKNRNAGSCLHAGEVFSGTLIRAGHVRIAVLLSIIMHSLDGVETTSEPSSNVKRYYCRFRSSSW